MFFSVVAVCLLFCAQSSSAQFFTKGAHSIPRMGRRSDLEDSLGSGQRTLPSIVRKVARSLKFAFELVERYDEDGNGQLDAEELMDLPMIQSAVRRFYSDKEPQATEEPRHQEQPSREVYSENLIM